MDEKDDLATVRIEFTKTPSYKVLPATGAWCTETTSGQILCDFLVESEEPPKGLTLNISSDGKPLSEKERDFSSGAPGYVRTFMAGIVMTPEVAEMVGQLLIDVAHGKRGNKAGTDE
jgi:hypothetical protein